MDPAGNAQDQERVRGFSRIWLSSNRWRPGLANPRDQVGRRPRVRCLVRTVCAFFEPGTGRTHSCQQAGVGGIKKVDVPFVEPARLDLCWASEAGAQQGERFNRDSDTQPRGARRDRGGRPAGASSARRRRARRWPPRSTAASRGLRDGVGGRWSPPAWSARSADRARASVLLPVSDRATPGRAAAGSVDPATGRGRPQREARDGSGGEGCGVEDRCGFMGRSPRSRGAFRRAASG